MKSIDDYRLDLQDALRSKEIQAHTWLLERKEEIGMAFVAKYGCQPEECVIVERELPRPYFGKEWVITRKFDPNQGQAGLCEVVAELVTKHGGIRATARATGLSAPYIGRLRSGHQTAPSDEALAALGIKRLPATYALVKK